MTKPKTINNVCRQCGLAASTLTCLVKFGELPKKPAFDVSTFHRAKCDCCGWATDVTEARDFFYPDFSLLSDEFIRQLTKDDAQED